jgi:AraC-like DNA-binding protein
MKTSQLQRDVYSHLVSELEETGITLEQLLSEFKRKEESETTDSQSKALLRLETAVELSRDPTLALRLGQRIGIGSYGSFGFALMSCANLRESTELLLRYGKLFFEPGWKIQDHDNGLLLRLNLTRGTAVQQQILTELCFSQISAIGTSLYRRRLEGAEIYFKFSKPAHASSYQSMLNAEVSFDAEHSELFLPAHVLDTEVKTRNISDHVVFHQQCEEMLRGLGSAQKTTAAVRQLLIQSAGDFPDIGKVALNLHVSERTLRRRLEAESTNFRSTFDEIRDLLAKEYLAKTVLTVADIAHMLDYSETVNFRRAFVRWNEMTPFEYRQRQRA